MERKKITPQELLARKQEGKKIVRVVCYDYPMALLADRAGVDSILVGDSSGMVVAGRPNTLDVTMEEMIYAEDRPGRAGEDHRSLFGGRNPSGGFGPRAPGHRGVEPRGPGSGVGCWRPVGEVAEA